MRLMLCLGNRQSGAAPIAALAPYMRCRDPQAGGEHDKQQLIYLVCTCVGLVLADPT